MPIVANDSSQQLYSPSVTYPMTTAAGRNVTSASIFSSPSQATASFVKNSLSSSVSGSGLGAAGSLGATLTNSIGFGISKTFSMFQSKTSTTPTSQASHQQQQQQQSNLSDYQKDKSTLLSSWNEPTSTLEQDKQVSHLLVTKNTKTDFVFRIFVVYAIFIVPTKT